MRIPIPWARMGLTHRIIFYVVVVAAVPVALIALIGFRAGSQGIRSQTQAHLKSVVLVKAQEVERWYRPLEATARILVESANVKLNAAALLGPENTRAGAVAAAEADLVAYLDGIARRQIGLQGIAILSPDLKAVVASTTSSQAFNLQDVSASMKQGTAPNLYLERYAPRRQPANAIVTAPVRHNGVVLAYVALSAPPLPLFEAFAPDPGLGSEGKLFLVDSSGYLLTPLQQVATDNLDTARMSKVVGLAGNQGASGIDYTDFLGQEVVGAYQPLELLGWGVVAEIPVAVAFGSIDRMRWAIAGASASFILLTLLVAIFLTRSVTRPLHVLTQGAQAIGSGNLDHRIEVSSADEIGELALSFNQMTEDLRATQTRALEAEKTATLQTFTERKVEQLNQVNDLALMIATETSLENLINEAPGMARQICGAGVAALIVFQEGENLRVEQTGYSGQGAEKLVEKIMLHDDILSFLREHTIGHQNSLKDIREPYSVVLDEFNETLICPLHSESGEVAGAVLVARIPSELMSSAQELQELMRIIGGYVSAALQNLRRERMLQESEQKAVMAVEELRSTQEQLVQSQKMESIGKLAGGLAHDFNNLLTPIIGYAQLGMKALSPGDERLRSNLLEIQKAAERSSDLTRQLLAFSRRQVVQPRVINLNKSVLNMEKMLKRMIGEDIELVTIPESDLGMVKVDPGQIEQILMNLAVNARDAMPQGGRLIIETSNAVLDRSFGSLPAELTPGDYVHLTVSDTGTGISDDVKAHIFEPFFTTKGEGEGTGLGLATCYGIVKQNGGHIAVESEPGKGTTFKIYLSRINEEASPSPATEDIDHLPSGTETVLLVEDESAVRRLAAHVLREQGYTVLEAPNGIEALRIVQEYSGQKIHLLLTDVVMPLMGGKELAEQLRARFPTMKVLFASGYSDEAIVGQEVLSSNTAFTQKPFSPVRLANDVREVLD